LYIVEVEDKAQDCLLPKLIVQPLVENACIHGVEAITNKKRVIVSAVVKEKLLIITVSDNGGGMTLERLDELKKMLNHGQRLSTSVGLYNVYQRLLLYYGNDFSFDVESIQGEGTRCVIKIPENYPKETDRRKDVLNHGC